MRQKRDTTFRDFVLDQLEGFDDITCNAMFGGFGLYKGEKFFGIIHKSTLYLKTSDKTRPDFEKRGMGPFTPSEKQVLKNYYEVPADILEDADELRKWVLRTQ